MSGRWDRPLAPAGIRNSNRPAHSLVTTGYTTVLLFINSKRHNLTSEIQGSISPK